MSRVTIFKTPFMGFGGGVIFEEFLNRFLGWFYEKTCYPVWYPAVDVYETSDNLTVEAELPGVMEKDIEVKIEGEILQISGFRNTSCHLLQRCHRLERPQGYFSRRFILPIEMDIEKTSASLKDGILTVIIPKIKAGEKGE